MCLFLVLSATTAAADCLTPGWESHVAPISVSSNIRNTMAVGDFDRDGIADAVIARTSGADTAMFHRGTGNGSFAAPVDIYPGPVIHDFAARDFNGDGKLDLLFSEDYRSQLVFLPGNGDGTFGNPSVSPADIGELFAIADLTGDHVHDVAAFNYSASGPSVVLFAGSGTGTFAEVRRIPLAAPPYAIAAGDLDGDGANDLVVGYADLTNLDLLFGNDDGTFDPAVSRTSGSWATRIALADLESDGDLDIVAVNYFDRLSVLRNLGARTFGAVTLYPVLHPYQPERRLIDVAAADVTGDGTLDLLVTGYNHLATLRGLAGAAFDTAYFEQLSGNSVAAGPIGATTDFDGDGRVDVIMAQNTWGRVRALRNRCGDVTVSLTATTPTISAGQSATVHVTTSGYAESVLAPAPILGTGSVTIVEGNTVLATGTVSGGEASVSVPGLALGEHTLVAHYAGDAQHEPAQSAGITVRVTSVTTTTTLTVDPSPSVYGQEVRLRTAVTSSDGTNPSGGTTESGIGTYTGTWIDDLPVGSHTAFARYLGDATHAPSGTVTAGHEVLKATPNVNVSTVELRNAGGSNVTVSVTVLPRYSGSPSGTIHLYDRNVLIGTRQISIGSASRFDLDGLATGRHDFRAEYGGDSNFHPAASALISHQAFPPAGLHIDARGSTSGISLLWPYPTGESRVFVYRTIAPSLNFAGGYGIHGSAPQPQLDQNASAGVVYLYRLEVRNPATDAITATSAIDLGVRMAFTEDPLLPGMTIRASHLQEIVAATNFLRGQAGQPLVTFDDASAGNIIRASHITALRTRINEARVALGAAAVTFSRTISPGDPIRAQDLQELREAVH